MLEKLAGIVETKALEDVTAADKTAQVMALALVFGVTEPYHHFSYGEDGPGKAWTRVAKINYRKNGARHVLEQLWVSVRTVLCRSLQYSGPITQTPTNWVKAAETLAFLVGVDIKALKADIEAEITEPRAWANLNADGTPKNGKSKKTAKKEKSTTKKNGSQKKSQGD